MLKLLRKVIGKADGESTAGIASVPVLMQPAAEEELPRYPPFMKGLPVSHPDKLIETQRELIGQIRESGLASKEVFEEYYLEPLRRFASYAHLLPASEAHHHRGAGGLLRHAIEVALWSLQSGDRVLLPEGQTPRRRRELEPRWHLAVFLAALCHDVGKPITDLTVTSKDGASVWEPFAEDLYSWAISNNIDRYFLHWRKNRGTNHTTISLWMTERIVSQKGLAWIKEGDSSLVQWMLETIAGQTSQENMIHNLVVRSDQVSVQRDIESYGNVFASYDIGIPVERILLDIMRRLVSDGTWIINEPGSRLWHMEGHLYVVWPVGGEEIAAVINQDKMPGLPRTPNSILDMLVERKLADFGERQSDGNRCWLIAPAPLAEKIPNIRLSAIRICNPAMIADPLFPSVAGKVISGSDTSPTSAGESAVVINEYPVSNASHSKESPIIRQVEAPTVAEPDVPPADRLDGAVGEALKALAEDIRSGDKDCAKLTHIDSTGVLCLKWPDAFKGYGLENKTILDELGRRNWLVVDPMAPFRKVSEVEVGIGAPWKVIRLQPVVKSLLDIGTQIAPASKERVEPADPTGNKPVKPDRKLITSPKDEGAAEKIMGRKLALLEQVVAILRQAVTDGTLVAQQENGYCRIRAKDADPLLKTKIKESIGQISALHGVDPARFSTEDIDKRLYYRIPA